MDPSRWQRVRTLFERALELEPEERHDFLERECAGDEVMRTQVEGLLRADQGPEALPAPPTPATLAEILEDVPADLAPAPGPGTRIGAYVLRRAIASGGMGTVFEATRVDDFEQTVAIKLIRPGAGGAELLRRFHAERQTLARLDHPGIARLLDGGATEDGQPYLVMEYIEGEPIDRWCDERRATVAERLRLFRAVCSAVQDAHRKLVVHRDIKPGNILVDDEGRPKLLDFGIAKVLSPEGDDSQGDEPSQTSPNERPMTREYASPEQVRGEPITTASDVYSLGVLLYELLIGRRPYRQRTQLAHELELSICEEEAQRPSTALGRPPQDSLEDSVTSYWSSAEKLAARRSTDPGRLRRQLAGDLDAICLQALRKEPASRYASAEQLGQDVENHLAGHPVRAQRDTWRYRSGKFLRRHRAAVGTAVAVGLLLLSSGVGLLWSSTLAASRATEVLQLMQVADLTDLEDYVAEVDRLWPAVPERAHDMRRWLAKARTLGDQLDGHRAALQRLRARALPYTDEDRTRDRETHPATEEIADLEMRRAGLLHRLEAGGPEELGEELEWAEGRLAELEVAVEERRSWRFTDDRDRWQHDKLAELVEQLEDFVADQEGLIAQIEERLAFAESVVRRTIEEPRAEWEEASAAVADRMFAPAYDGLALPPQLGLLPLGPDPASGLWEFAHLQTGEPAVRGADGELEIDEETGLVFVLVPGGRFRMGANRPIAQGMPPAPNIDAAAIDSEGPVHEVELAPFFLSKYEMTQGQWLRFTRENPSQYLPGQVHGALPNDLSHPVESVSWEEAEEVLARLGLELPTEAQWEYAARAGTTTPWWTGDDPASLEGVANVVDRTAARAQVTWPSLKAGVPDFEDGYIATAPVGIYGPNPFGLHDTHGNVWEWCKDDFANYDLPVAEGTGERLYKGSPRRTGRGGSFTDAPFSARSSHRGAAEPQYRDQNLGLRPARGIESTRPSRDAAELIEGN